MKPWHKNAQNIVKILSNILSLRHVSRVGSIVNIALFQIVNDILVFLALDGEVAKMDEMRGKFLAEICGAMLHVYVVNIKRREISCMVRKELSKRNIPENYESDLPWLKCCFSKFVS